MNEGIVRTFVIGILFGTGGLLLLSTTRFTLFPPEGGWHVSAAAIQYGAALGCYALGAAIAGWF